MAGRRGGDSAMMTDQALVSAIFEDVLARFPMGKAMVLQRSGGVYEIVVDGHLLRFENALSPRIARVVMAVRGANEKRPSLKRIFHSTRPDPNTERVSFDEVRAAPVAQVAEAIYQAFLARPE
jgi:hypothetical protein